MKQTQDELKNYPIEEIHLKVWNKFFAENSYLNVKQKTVFGIMPRLAGDGD